MTAKKQQKYPVREPKGRDNRPLARILGAAGVDGTVGQGIGLALRGVYENNMHVAVQAGAQAVTGALTSAMKDPETVDVVEAFLFDVWNPKLSVGEDEDYDQKKRAAWDDVPLRAWSEIAYNYTQTEGFSDFLRFYMDIYKDRLSSGASSIPSKEATGSQT
jgi:hypothetical protein